ncbi:MAG: Glucose--fructose oxidoreductase precursor [Verrucomicrobiota bacterium]
MGSKTLHSVARHPKVKLVALCDVDDRFLTQAAKDFTGVSRHRDWRELFSARAGVFDAVTIATPDHMHAAPALTALRARKHVYLQKPMATTLQECRVLTQEAAKTGVVTQLGNQFRSTIENRMTVELLRQGAIGKIREVIVWENKPCNWWPKKSDPHSAADAIPSALDWDLWLGVRAPRHFLADSYHPTNWRAWFDFASGMMGDMAVHHLDPTFDALQLTSPQRVRQRTPGSTGPLWSPKRIVEMIFPGNARTVGKTVQLTWHDGFVPDRSRILLPSGVSQIPESGTCWLGERGAIFKNFRGGRPFVLPESAFPTANYPRDFEPRDHYLDWVNAILEGRRACSDFSHSGPLSEAVLVGTLADRLAGEWLEWDQAALKFDRPEATALVQREYRSGWKVPGLG